MTRNRNKESMVDGSRIGVRHDRGELRQTNIGGIWTCGMTSSGESGRSMVEMLGVLAIIGVLSIGGIAGYRYAMTKYHANEILNEVRKRAVVASQQRILGQTDINLNEFASKINNAYTVTTPDVASGQFALAVGDIPANICEEVKKHTLPIAIGETRGDCSGETNSLTFTFANDLGDGTESGGDDFGSGDTGVCENGNVYLSYNVGHECEEETPGDFECKKNSDCNGKEADGITCASGTCFCNLNNTNGECNANVGRCETIASKGEYTGLKALGYMASTEAMSWWAAENWCKAQGKRLIRTSTFGCAGGVGTGSISGYCNESESGAGWENGDAARSATMRTIKEAIGSDNYCWTGTTYDGDFCMVHYLSLDEGMFVWDYRQSGAIALCE